MMALPSECSSETLIRPSVRHFCHCFLRGQGGRVGRYQLFSCFFYFISLYQKQHVIISFPFHAIEAQTREQRSPAASLVRPPPLNFKFYFKFNLFLWRKKRRCSAVLRTFQFSVVEDCYQLPRSPSLLLSSPNKVQCVASISYVVVLWFWCVGRRSLGRKRELVDFGLVHGRIFAGSSVGEAIAMTLMHRSLSPIDTLVKGGEFCWIGVGLAAVPRLPGQLVRPLSKNDSNESLHWMDARSSQPMQHPSPVS